MLRLPSPHAVAATSSQEMLRLRSSAALRPPDPAANGALASPQQHNLPRAATSAPGMVRFSAAAAFHPAASQQSLPPATTGAQGMLRLSSTSAYRPADPAARGSPEFDHFVVIDFEATCERDSKIYPQEIIEFPAVLVDAATGALVSSFRTYVRPLHHPRLTAFCSELTGIQQDQVDGGVDLAQALVMHDSWLTAAGVTKNRLAVVTWGDWDCRTMLESECSFKCLSKPSYFNRWVNLRVPFEAAFGPGRRNLQEAVHEAGLRWNGRLHCGLDDAHNTACLLVELMRRGVAISITGSLKPLPQSEPEPQLQRQRLQPQLQQQQAPLNHNLSYCTQQAPMDHNLSYCNNSTIAVDCCCYCGVAIRRGVTVQGQCFLICGNWTPTLGPMCPFFLLAA